MSEQPSTSAMTSEAAEVAQKPKSEKNFCVPDLKVPHHIVFESPAGQASLGVCRNCGYEKIGYNSSEWGVPGELSYNVEAFHESNG